MTFLAGIAGPVQVDRNGRRLQALAHRLGKAGHLLGTFLFVSEQHQEGAELGVLGLAVEQHAHGFTGFLSAQVARAALAFAEDAYELGKRVFRRGDKVHRQFVGLGRPASLAASLAGAPLNSRLRCRLLPFSGPSLSATYLISGRLAGDSWNSA